MPPEHAVQSRAFTLIEAILVVLVLAVAVPTAMQMLGEAGQARRQGADAARAVTLGMGVMESILADVHSAAPGLGLGALADPAGYLSTPTTGLYDRLGTLSAPYDALGMTYAVTIGDLANASGVTTGDADEDVFRRVTVTVSFEDPDGGALQMPISMIVADLGA